MKKLLVANYKMNGNINFYKRINKLINKLQLKDTNVILCPPFVYMPFFKIKNKNVYLGAQDISLKDDKKSTGQISAKMLKEFNVKYSIIGHCERREIGETDAIIADKINNAQTNNITPIVCVGEKNQQGGLDVLAEQVKYALNKAVNKEIIFVYEPVWAIGSGVHPTIKKINKAIKLIKDTAISCGFETKVLYGGSVELSNIKEISLSNADGFLLGGVSLKVDEFISIFRGINE